MNILERQIASSLDQIHAELAQSKGSRCRWEYDGGKDTYSCPHIAISGRDMVARIDRFNYYPMRVDSN